MRTLLITLVSSSFVLLGCSDAQKAAEVTPAFVSTTKYSNLSCSALRSEAERARANVAQLEGNVDKAYRRDKGAEAVAWILFWPAALAMNGNDSEANQLAQAKGDSEAIRSSMLSKGCNP